MYIDAILYTKEKILMPALVEIEGIGPARAAKLHKAGVRGLNGLLKMGATRKGRLELAKATGFDAKTILEWVNHADLFRVKGIGTQYSDLLEAAGVDTAVELAKRKPEALLEAMTKANIKLNKVNQMPGLSNVKAWIKHAKTLKRVVEY
jgi:predicted flap endonuclease-1-like 5' DNA nuclease